MLMKHSICDSSNPFYVGICPKCGKEYNTKLELVKPNRESPFEYQPENQKLKVEVHLRRCGKGIFKIFPVSQMQMSAIDLDRSYKRNFIEKYEKVKVAHVLHLS